VLAPLALAGDHDTGRLMGDPDRRIGGVDVLAAGTAGTIGIDPQVGLVDLHLDVIGNLGKDEDRGKGGMSAATRIER